MTALVALLAVLAGAWIAHGYMVAAAERRLAEHPPERAWLRVSAGRGMSDSEVRMLRMLRALGDELVVDTDARRRGERQIRLLALASRDAGDPEAAPTLSTYVAADADQLAAVSSAMREQFGAGLSIERVSDPLAAWRPPRPR